MRPPGMRPTTPPCDARTIFGAPFVACPNRGPSGRVRVSSLTWFQILHVHFGIGAREDACFAVGERDLREVVVVGE